MQKHVVNCCMHNFLFTSTHTVRTYGFYSIKSDLIFPQWPLLKPFSCETVLLMSISISREHPFKSIPH